jgi:hypothetical protein
MEDFINSNMYRGTSAYPTVREKPWYGFLYLAKGSTEDKYKVGYTNYDLRRRSRELNRDDIDTPFYIWASPNPQVLEKYVKNQLVQFTKPVGKYSSEIFYNIPQDVLIDVIRLIILYTVLKERWYSDEGRYRVLDKWFGGVPFNVIKHNGTTYSGGKIEKPDEYAIDTRVMVTHDGIEWEGKINSNRIELKSKDTNKMVPAYNVLFEDSQTQQDYKESDIRPLYSDIDMERIFDYNKVQEELIIKKEVDLKL